MTLCFLRQFSCKKVVAQELLRALEHVKITSFHTTHRLEETVRKLQINIEGLIEGDQPISTITVSIKIPVI